MKSWIKLGLSWTLPAIASGLAFGKTMAEYGNLPISFEANAGQTDAAVKFTARAGDYRLFLTASEAVLDWRSDLPRRDSAPVSARTYAPKGVLRMKLLGANPRPRVTGIGELPGKSHFFFGSNPAGWRTNVPTYRQVRYAGVYPGIDLVYYGNGRQLEYDFLIAAGADPGRIRFSIVGDGTLQIDKQGDLVLQSDAHEFRLHQPTIYQGEGVARRPVHGRFVVKYGRQVSFQIAKYDSTKTLIIDPVLSFSTFLGGNSFERGEDIAVDSGGNVYIAGETSSSNFPTANPYQPSYGGGVGSFGGGAEGFVSKLNAAGTELIYSTYFGGSDQDLIFAMALDSSGNVYLTGRTLSRNFPTARPLQATFAGGGNGPSGGDAFVTKLNAAGSALVYSTYLGGAKDETGWGIAVDAFGNAYIAGQTDSTNFPNAHAYQSVVDGGSSTSLGIQGDAFVSKLNSAGSALVYSTYLGGGSPDYAAAIAVDSAGCAYVTGTTFSGNFPLVNPFQAAPGSGTNAFVAKFNAAGSALLYSTFLGGSGRDDGNAITVDSSGNAYVGGDTSSQDFPLSNAFQAVHGGLDDAFLTKFKADGSGLVYSTFLGGRNFDEITSVVVDSVGTAYVTGQTSSPNFPVSNALQPTLGGIADAFMTRINAAGSALLSSTFLGGSEFDQAAGIALDSVSNVYVTGSTNSPNFPVVKALQQSYAGRGDVFITKFLADTIEAPEVRVLNAASYAVEQPVTPGSLIAIFGANLADSTAGADTIPLPTALGGTSVLFNNIPAPLLFVSPGQINAQLPWVVISAGVTPGTVSLVVRRGATSSKATEVPIGTHSPGIFTLGGTGRGPAVALNEDGVSLAQTAGSVSGFSSQPARIGRFISFYASGLGMVDPAPPRSGETAGATLRTVVSPVSVLIGGVLVRPDFAGLAPQFVGVYQVNVRIPTGAPIGDSVSLQIQIGDITSTLQTTIAVSP